MDVTRADFNNNKGKNLKLQGDSHTGGFGGNCPPGQTYSQSQGKCV